MANITCAISGITFRCEHIGSMNLSASIGYYHPVFALPSKRLLHLYSAHCQGQLEPTDSYLLFLAYLYSTEQVTFHAPCSLSPTAPETSALIERNLRQLIEVIELTATISTPAFKQPSYAIYAENSALPEISSWVAAWNRNIEDFRNGYRNQKLEDSLRKVENSLSKSILSGSSPSTDAAIIANWADRAGSFPASKAEAYKLIIRTCFNSEKMFSTPLASIKEVKAYCEENIDVGSIHFHTLYETLKEGIRRHKDYLGLGYTLLPTDFTAGEKEVAAMRERATVLAPSRLDYASDLDFLRAKLRFKAVQHNPTAEDTSAPTVPLAETPSLTEDVKEALMREAELFGIDDASADDPVETTDIEGDL